MARYLCLIIFVAVQFQLHAQTGKKGEIKGKVNTENNKPADNATVSLLTLKDSVLIKAAVPDKDGSFDFENIKQGGYLISVSQVGYAKYFSASVVVDENNLLATLPPIYLTPSTHALTALTVEAKKPFIERKLDRLIVNVENSIVGAGGTVLNVLERSPGVSVNEEAGISLRGKQGLVFMIDGKPSPLSGTDLINYLKSVPSSTIEKIEIITNPSAKYDAAGNAGIINIVFKKDQRQGLNGNYTLSYGQGVYYKPSVAANINFRKKKWNLFGNYSIAEPKNFTKFYINRKFFDQTGATASVFDQTSFIKQPINSQNIKLGADFYATKKTVIGVMFNANVGNSTRDGFTNALITGPAGDLQYTTQSNNTFEGKNSNLFGNINFKHTFDSTGKELTVDADFGKYHSKALQDFINQYFSAGGYLTSDDRLKTDQQGTITVKSLKADYIRPLKNGAKFEAGIKTSFVKTDNDIKFFTVNGNTVTIDATRSNHFIYDENINAAYINYAKEFKKTDVQLGFRAEQTVTNGKQIATGDKFSRNYVQLFPSFFINQKLSEDNQLSFSYSRRIDRPTYRQLNPFKIFVDPYTYVVGDPSLKPVLTNSFEIDHTFKNKYITSLSYVKSKAVITDIFTQDDATKISYQSPANLQDYEQYNLGVTIPFSIKQWLNSNLISSVYWNKYTSPLQGGQLMTDYTTWDINSSNSFVIGKKGWSAELNGYYQSKQAWGLFFIKNLAQVSTGIQKTSKDKKSTFKLAMSDLFYTNHIAVIVKYQNQDFHTNRTWDSRAVTFSFTHRFGKNTVARARQRTTGVEDEKKRAN